MTHMYFSARANGRISYGHLVYTFFSLISLQVRPLDVFLRVIAQKTRNHARTCLFGVIKPKFNFKHLFIPRIVKFWPKTGSTENA